MGGKVRAAYNTWAGRGQASAADFAKFEVAGKRWAAGSIRVGFLSWLAYAEAQKLLPEGGLPRPISPNAKRRVKWARDAVTHAEVREVTADDKYQCQRSLLSPYAALVLRYDGAVLRVVAVHRPPSEALCTLDLTRGFDELMLSEVPAVDRRSDEAARNGPPLRGGSRISAGALSPPHHMLVVPCFFGGVIHLRNDIDVRVIDARFEPSAAPLDPDDDPTTFVPEKTLSHVLLTLVDSNGESVGRPSWAALQQVLELLPPDAIFVADSASEDDMRKKRRLELHRSEQRRLALHHLRLSSRQVPTAWGEGAGGGPNSSPLVDHSFDSSAPSGVEGLVKQLYEAAPSKLLITTEALGEAPPSRNNRARGSAAGRDGGGGEERGGLAGYYGGGGSGGGAAAAADAAFAAAYGGGGSGGLGGYTAGRKIATSSSARAFTAGYDGRKPGAAYFR